MLNHTKVKKLMDEKGVLQWELAYSVGISEAAMSYILRGLKQPSLVVADRIAERLGVTIDDLVSRETTEDDIGDSYCV